MFTIVKRIEQDWYFSHVQTIDYEWYLRNASYPKQRHPSAGWGLGPYGATFFGEALICIDSANRVFGKVSVNRPRCQR